MSGTLAIPASDIVSVLPSVLGGGGNALDLSGLILTTTPRVPIGTVMLYPSQTSVATAFGATSQEATLAGVYFLGYNNSTQKPGALLFAQYNTTTVGAWLRGGSMTAEGYTLTQLQALSGTIIVTIDGVPYTSSTINLSAATSFSNAAELMSIGLGLVGNTQASFTGAIATTVLTVSAVSSGTIALGQEVRGTGITAGTVISSFGTGSGGTGTYNLSISQTVSSEPMTAVIPTITYDSIAGGFVIQSPSRGTSSSIGYATGTLATVLNLTLATGAMISQGAVPAVPASFMNNITVQTQNWCSFMTTFDPDNGVGNTQKQAFSAWVNASDDRYVYVAWDTDVTPTLSTNATASLGNILNVSDSSGTIPIYSPTQGPTIAAFEMGAIASVDFTATQGRATMKFRSQTGITPDVYSQSVSTNLVANGYNFYGIWATANQTFQFFSPGQISGPFNWIDSYINQIWLNNQFQLAQMELLINIPHIPYNAAGQELVRAAMKDPINQAGNFGAYEVGVVLSAAQIAEVNTAAGFAIDTTLTNLGWYLLIGIPTSQVRQARGTFPMTFWYMDGEAVQQLSLASVLIQ